MLPTRFALTTLVLLTTLCRAQEGAVARVAATAPAATRPLPADAAGKGGPKVALEAFARAAEAGDFKGAGDLWHATRPVGRKLAAALTRQFVAYAAIRRAASDRIGGAAGTRLKFNDAPSAALAAAKEAVTGDLATVEWVDAGGTPRDMALVRVAGAWKLSLTPWIGQRPDDGEASEIADEAAELAGRMERVAGEVRAGRCKTIEEIDKALDR
jgi:hypothetical protein